MPSLFGTGSGSKTVYHKIENQGSDSEFSLSDDEKVLSKKKGEIEPHLCPETRIQRAKKSGFTFELYLGISVAILLIVAALTVVAIVYTRTHNTTFTDTNDTDESVSTVTTKKPLPGMQIDKSLEGWSKTFKDAGGEGSIRLLDMDGDGLDDILISTTSISGSNIDHERHLVDFKGLHEYCESQGENGTYPCLATLIALRGKDGSELWRLPIRSDAFVINCEQFDINQDGRMDCIGTGRMSVVVAFDPYKGETLWTCEDDAYLEADWNTYKAAALPDWDGDGVPEVLIANGGDVTKRPSQHDRDPGRLVVLSGATGIPMGDQYLDMPHRKETYMSPVIVSPNKDTATYILFGSGGETVPGDLMGISVNDFCRYILGKDADACSEDVDKTNMGHLTRNPDGIFVIYNGKKKGVMVPPVIVDVDGDGTMDLLMTSFEGVMKLYDGHELIEKWTATFLDSETYGTPAPGYFDDDEYLDFMINWNKGAWMDYSSSSASVVSGKDGSILWTLESNFMQMSSSLSISTNLKHQDSFLFKVQGRDSKFRWEDGKLIRPDKSTDRKKRHEESTHDDDAQLSPEELQKKLYNKHLNCDDDLSSFSGEIFVIDRTMLHNPIRLFNIPTHKHTYDPSTIKSHDDGPPSGSHQGNPAEPPGNQDGSHDQVTSSPDSGNVNPGSDDSPRRLVKRADSRAKSMPSHMCVVESPEYMGLGVIGNMDGDENLDFVFINEINAFVLDANMSPTEGLAEFTVQKLNMEIGIQDGVFKHVAVNASTSMTPYIPAGIPGNKQKTFLPKKQQKWTQYMGTMGTSTYV